MIKEKISFDNMKLPIAYDNKITIQLFDELTGKQVEEIKTHNLITNGVSKLAYLDRYWFILRKGVGNSSDNNYYNYGGDMGLTMPNLFNWLILTNSGLTEDANTPFMQGITIGYAVTFFFCF